MVRDAWIFWSCADVREGELVSMFLQHQSMFLAQQSGQLGVFSFQVLLEQVDRANVLHAEHSRVVG